MILVAFIAHFSPGNNASAPCKSKRALQIETGNHPSPVLLLMEDVQIIRDTGASINNLEEIPELRSRLVGRE